jgi:hypothetical protein
MQSQNDKLPSLRHDILRFPGHDLPLSEEVSLPESVYHVSAHPFTMSPVCTGERKKE